jgi:hypothetical protein
VSQKSQELLAFVHQLPQGGAYAPIYVKGSHLHSGKESKGKTPLEKSHHVVMGLETLRSRSPVSLRCSRPLVCLPGLGVVAL